MTCDICCTLPVYRNYSKPATPKDAQRQAIPEPSPNIVYVESATANSKRAYPHTNKSTDTKGMWSSRQMKSRKSEGRALSDTLTWKSKLMMTHDRKQMMASRVDTKKHCLIQLSVSYARMVAGGLVSRGNTTVRRSELMMLKLLRTACRSATVLSIPWKRANIKKVLSE